MDLQKSIQTSFPSDYAEARDKFLEGCAVAGVAVKSYQNPHLGPKGEPLFTDSAWFGPRDARKLMVTVCATHGVEGFCGAAAQVDWLSNGGPGRLPPGVAALLIHAINPYGFAWLRRVTEEGVDLNRNFVDFSAPLPKNPGHAELADALVPQALSGPVFEVAEAKLMAWREKHGERAFQMACTGAQYTHPGAPFYGGDRPTWSRRTLETILLDYDLAARDGIAVIDYHTGLGPFGFGEVICGNEPGTVGHIRAKAWYGDAVTEPTLGTSSSVVQIGTAEVGWTRMLGDKVTFIALEFGTYSLEHGLRALREDHWLHNYSTVDRDAAETQRIKAQIRKHAFPDTEDWKEMVLFRSRQILRQTQVGLAAGQLVNEHS